MTAGLFLLLINTNFVTEWLGVALTYWRWYVTPPNTLYIWVQKYLFYAWFSVPPLLMTGLIFWRVSRVTRAGDSASGVFA